MNAIRLPPSPLERLLRRGYFLCLETRDNGKFPLGDDHLASTAFCEKSYVLRIYGEHVYIIARVDETKAGLVTLPPLPSKW
jgi:hypothetical protein